MKGYIVRAMTLVFVLSCSLLTGCKETPTAFNFGPIPHDHEEGFDSEE